MPDTLLRAPPRAYRCTIITYPGAEQGDFTPLRLTGTGYATRCARMIAEENIPDALWALEVLNKYGHLVKHPGDADCERAKL